MFGKIFSHGNMKTFMVTGPAKGSPELSGHLDDYNHIVG